MTLHGFRIRTYNKITKKGILYMVATPIGNLEDMTLRAIRILGEVDFIACEDTRVSGKLLKHYGIETKLISLHSHSKDNKYELILNKLVNGESIAYITDAGTPGVSDPGQTLIQRINELKNQETQELKNNDVVIASEVKQSDTSCHPRPDRGSTNSLVDSRLRGNDNKKNNNDIKIIPIPGASAVVAAVSVSDIVNKEFYFAGFLPKKKGRQTKFRELINLDAPIIIYESALRLERTLKDIREYFGGDAEVFVAREMTKLFEESWGGSAEEILSNLKSHKLKGEIVLIVKN